MTKTNADVTRAANSAVDAASAGLETYFQTMQSRVVSLLGEDRASFTAILADVQTMLSAVANEQHEIRAESKRDRGELLAGVHGVAQDVSVVVASVQEVTARQGKSETDIEALQAIVTHNTSRLDLFETKVAADIQERIGALEADNSRLAAVEASLKELVTRIGGALPTEADQDLSAQLRAERDGIGD